MVYIHITRSKACWFTQQRLKERNIQYEICKLELSHNGRQICEDHDNYNGFVKVVCRKVLSVTIVSENAGDQISESTVHYKQI